MTSSPVSNSTSKEDVMASSNAVVPSQEYQIKDLPTKSVTLYPARAHVVRDIDNVVLQPGANEIIIHGITPTADEHSVQIDGKGAATITDITVELVPNREIFEEVYPELDEPEEDSDDDSTDELEDPDEVKALDREIERLNVELKKSNEVINSAARGLDTLDLYTKSLRAEKSSVDDLTKTLSVYEQERYKIFQRHRDATTKVETSQKAIAKKEKERARAWIPEQKRRDKEMAAKAKELRKKQRQRAEKNKERLRMREEKLKFWPKKVYRVTVSLEAASTLDTPASSRRGSMDSVTLSRGYVPDAKDSSGLEPYSGSKTTVSLSLSYVTKEASWSPRYDLNISSVQKVATIAYRAEFVNGTSETWKDTQLILSTSQTSYQGLEDKVPFMHGWHVKLGRYQDQGLLSPEELNKPRYGNAVAPITNRNELFGSSQTTFLHGSQMQKKKQMQQQTQQQPASAAALFQSAANSAPMYNSSHGHFGQARSTANNAGSSIFANSNSHGSALMSTTIENVTQRGEQLDAATPRSRRIGGALLARSGARRSPAPGSAAEGSADLDVDEDAMEEPNEAVSADLGFQEAEWDDNGLTSTYDVPGHRTLVPASLTRRHKIATLNATNIHLSHVAVPKLRASAFLRAKIRNPSSTVTLLKGVAGLTLDGAFLGNTNMNRVSPGQLFDLSLGVDPAVHISYPKPSVHRSTQGIFNKESDQIFSRSVWVTNTKPVAIELLVLDQIPVSEDERLKIDILLPKGLSKEGDVVRAGSAAKQGASGATSTAPAPKSGDTWGKATATLKKDGEVAWTANIEKKQACLLKLEYEARMPAAEKIMPA